jgi:hypothetical protein
MALGVAIWLALAVLLAGAPALHSWIDVLTLYRQSISAQPDIASLAGLYTAWAPAGAVALLDAALVACGGLLVLAYRPGRDEGEWGSRRCLALGVATTLAVLPYAHTHDDVLLAIPLLLLMQRDWQGLSRPIILLAVAVTLLAPLGIWTDYHRPVVSALPAICTMAACVSVFRLHSLFRR